MGEGGRGGLQVAKQFAELIMIYRNSKKNCVSLSKFWYSLNEISGLWQEKSWPLSCRQYGTPYPTLSDACRTLFFLKHLRGERPNLANPNDYGLSSSKSWGTRITLNKLILRIPIFVNRKSSCFWNFEAFSSNSDNSAIFIAGNLIFGHDIALTFLWVCAKGFVKRSKNKRVNIL